MLNNKTHTLINCWNQQFIQLKYLISVAEHLTAQHSAIKMLHARVKLVLRYVQAVQNGELKGNHEVLRAACSLSHRLPVLNNPKFKADFYNVSILSQKHHNPLNHSVIRYFFRITFFYVFSNVTISD